MRAERWNGQFETITLPTGGVRWRLPARWTLGRTIGSATMLVIFGLLFGGAPLGAVLGLRISSGTLGLLALPIVAPFVLIGLGCVLLALMLAFGRSEVEIRAGELVAAERLGPLRIARRRALDSIVNFEVEGGAMRANRKAVEAASGGEFSTLRARLADESAKPWPIASVYPRDTLLALARALAAERTGGAGRSAPESAVVEVDWRAKERVEALPVERPAGTPITIEHGEGVTTIRVPPAGVKGGKGLIGFGVLWEVFAGVVCAGILWKLITNPGSVQGSPWVMAVVMPLFLSVGAGLTLYGLSLARRRTVLDIVGDTLLVTRSGLRRVRSWEWRASDLERVHVGPSGMEVNDRPVLALLVEPREGGQTVLLAERSPDELRWIAWEVERALGLAERAGSRAA